jgi:gamma-glutamyl-gamma-aminobutyrate hydrolase PuuD
MKKILITQKIFEDKYKQLANSIEMYWYDYFFKKNVILIPIGNSINFEKKFSELNPDSIILSGGGDIFKNKKNKENLLRDSFEKKLIKLSIKKKIPILAVCRGFQLVADLYKEKLLKVKGHVGANHLIEANIKSHIKNIDVNSYHNYGIKKLPKHFTVLARHSDGSIEIAKSLKYNILCTMFHPERKNKSQLSVNKLIFSHIV